MPKGKAKQLDFIESTIPYCDDFTWGEVLYLPQWDIYAFPDVNQFYNLKNITLKLQQIRNLFKSPINITSGLRPKLYNERIGGAKESYHMQGMALDFQIKGHHSDLVRSILKPRLDELNIRMENLPGSLWVHIDIAHTGRYRFFTP